jgi:hypothetical protein
MVSESLVQDQLATRVLILPILAELPPRIDLHISNGPFSDNCLIDANNDTALKQSLRAVFSFYCCN